MDTTHEAKLREAWATMGAKHCEVTLVIMKLFVTLQDAPEWLREWTRETVTKGMALERPADLTVWEAAVEGWE